MLNKIIAFMLLLAFTGQTFHKAIILISFYSRQEIIALTLCENKAKPKMKCNGTCQLSKKLKQEEQKDKSNPERKLENKFELVSFSSSIKIISPVLQLSRKSSFYNPATLTALGDDIFHPPC